MGYKPLLLTFAFITGIVLTACEKEPGKGGSSAISGRVIVRQYNANFTILVEQYEATDENVFIVYGGDDIYGDKTSTNYDGTFRFDYLRKGEYTVYAYSEDSANYPSQREIPVMYTVKVTDNKQEIKVPDIIILK
jgi:hypothetical protein